MCSSSCLLEEATGWCRCPFTGAIFMDRAVQNAAWLEIPTALGTAPSAPDTFQPPKGNTHTHEPIKPLSQRVNAKPWHWFTESALLFNCSVFLSEHTKPHVSYDIPEICTVCSLVLWGFWHSRKLKEREGFVVPYFWPTSPGWVVSWSSAQRRKW